MSIGFYTQKQLEEEQRQQQYDVDVDNLSNMLYDVLKSQKPEAGDKIIKAIESFIFNLFNKGKKQ